MLLGRESHSMVALNARYILVVGSRHTANNDKVEVYDVENDLWKEAPSLNEGRYYATLVSLNKRFIFTIGGINKSGVARSIEKYDSFIFYSKWQTLDLVDGGWDGRYFCGAHQISQT